MQQLAEIEELIATTADALFIVEEGEAADFLAYVWFFLSAQERLAGIAADADLGGAIDRLLAFQQLPAAISGRWRDLAGEVRSVYSATPPETRLRWDLDRNHLVERTPH